jgi:uncharacterized membrane protein
LTASPDDAASNARMNRAVVVSCLAVWLLLTVLSLVRHYTFHSSLYDLGIFHQLLWNTAHGRPFASSICHMNYLGDHFSPSLALLAPLEWLPRALDLLLVLHAGAVSLTAWNVHRLALRHLAPRPAALLALATLFSPQLYDPALADIHPEPFMAVALSLALLAIDQGALLVAGAWLLVVLGGKEDSALLLVPLGIVVAFEPGRRRFGVVVSVVCALYMTIVVGVVMPRLRPAGVGGDGLFYLGRFAHLGASPVEILIATFSHPLHAIATATTLKRLATLVVLLAPFAFAPLASRRALAVVPFAAAHYLSSRSTEFFFPFHYLVPVVPVLAWAAVGACSRRWLLGGPVARWCRVASVMVLGSAVLSIGWRFDPEPLTPRPNNAALGAALEVVPDGAPVCVENWFGAHLADRRDVDFCVLWEWDRGRYDYFGWPENSSARWQVFDLADTSEEHPVLPARLAELEAAGARVAFDRDRVTVLEVDEAVLARAPVIRAPPPSDKFRP